MCLGAGAFAAAVLESFGAVLPERGAASLADERPPARLVEAVPHGGVFGHVVVQLQERHRVDGGVAVVDAVDADAELAQCGVEHALEVGDAGGDHHFAQVFGGDRLLGEAQVFRVVEVELFELRWANLRLDECF